MQYVGRAFGSVSKTWSSINPATLSGAIDVIVVEHPDGTLACSPFHVRFGKFRILKPSQKKVQVIVNGKSTNIPMKLGESGEAYFVFETNSNLDDIPEELLSSPVMSAVSSPPQSPDSASRHLDDNDHEDSAFDKEDDKSKFPSKVLEEPDFLDINNGSCPNSATNQTSMSSKTTESFPESINKKLAEINIPSKIDNNGDLLLDIEGYKPDHDKIHDTDKMIKKLLMNELGDSYDIHKFIKEDHNGNIRIVNPQEQTPVLGSPPTSSDFNADGSFTGSQSPSELLISDGESPTESKTSGTISDISTSSNTVPTSFSSSGQNFIKTLRLTSDQLKCLNLQYGENELEFSVDQGKAIVKSKLFVWRWDIPIVISDIDGTITKSDALGHVMTMIGKDWTHLGVAKLFTEIARNGYNIMYLTARSAGQADSTRGYLASVEQRGYKLPSGPVILSPDRTMAALRREVILKKPEIFKIACLNDIRSIYVDRYEQFHTAKNTADDNDNDNDDEKPTPFCAGFGNRITDALSYRTVGIPSSRIFTINTEGEVHMELLELAGFKSSYIFINELVDQFFPPVKGADNNYDASSINLMVPGSPRNTSFDAYENSATNIDTKSFLRNNIREEKFTDTNFWREPLLDIDNLSDFSDNSEYSIDKNLVEAAKKGNKKLDKFVQDTHKNERKQNHDSIDILESNKSKKHDFTNDLKSTPFNLKPRMTKEELGNQIYLELGSPLSSPKMGFLDSYPQFSQLSSKESTPFIATDFDSSKINLQNHPVHPIAGVSKVNVFENTHKPLPMDQSDYEEPSDDEFDEDEFVE